MLTKLKIFMANKSKILLSIILLMIVLLTLGCGNPTATGSIKDYFPIAEGSTWNYLGEGNEFASFKREILYSDENRAQYREDTGGTVSSSIIEIREEEIVRTFFQGEQYEPLNLLEAQPNDDLIILKGPLQTGTSWDTATDKREIKDVKATVETPAGTFKDCIQVSITNDFSVMNEYYCAGVGLVKREFIMEETTVTSTLDKYEISQ